LVLGKVETGLAALLEKHGDLHFGPVNQHVAWKLATDLLPDVIVLGDELVETAGLVFLRMLLVRHHVPVILVLSRKNIHLAQELSGLSPLLAFVIYGDSNPTALAEQLKQKLAEIQATSAPRQDDARAENWIIAVGASAGGPEALRLLLQAMPPDSPPILIVQHMPAPFVQPFADRLNANCSLEIRVARNGESLLPGQALVGPSGTHLHLARDRNNYVARLSAPVCPCLHKPSADELFSSVAQVAGARAIGVILTGMGADGAVGIKKIRDAGGHTLAQNEESCAVFGMPKEAMALGGIEKAVALEKIPREISAILKASSARERSLSVDRC
jgi:two-component system chemotaxis response regulator CheB